MRKASCRACGQPIFFALSIRGEKMPVDAVPDEDGNILLARNASGELIANVLRPAQASGARASGQLTYNSHFRHCPQADVFRQRARARQAKR